MSFTFNAKNYITFNFFYKKKVSENYISCIIFKPQRAALLLKLIHEQKLSLTRKHNNKKNAYLTKKRTAHIKQQQ